MTNFHNTGIDRSQTMLGASESMNNTKTIVQATTSSFGNLYYASLSIPFSSTIFDSKSNDPIMSISNPEEIKHMYEMNKRQLVDM